MKKKCLFVVPDLQMGGIQRVTSVISSELNNFYEVDILTYFEQNPFYETRVNDIYFLNKMEYIKFLLGKGIRKYSDIILKKPVNPKIIYHSMLKKIANLQKQNNYQVIVLVAGGLLMATELKKNIPDNVKVVSWVHNSADVYFNDYFKRDGHYFIDGISSCDQLICLTKADKLIFDNYNSNVAQIYNPLTMKPNIKAKLENKQISFVGRIAIKHKGIDFLCEIISRSDEESMFVIAGGGNDANMNIFHNLIKKYKINEKISLKGVLKDDELADVYGNSSLYIMTSRWEGFGLSLLEAMSYGLPVIAYNQTGSNEILEDGKYGILVENGNIEEFSKKLNELINDKSQLKFWGQKSLERASHFRIEAIIKEWLNFI